MNASNHDQILSRSCFEAVRHHFYSTQEVTVAGSGERVYDVYGQHLGAFTHGDIKHGDIKKKQMRKIGDTITAEARQLVMQETRDTVLFTGHLHHKAADIIDQSGRLQLQASSPSPDDEYHVGEGYVGARKQIQLYMMESQSQDDMTLGIEVQGWV